ncbi:MAG: translocation/assembly module TamB domain-containing protein [Pseudomonadota bacterium]
MSDAPTAAPQASMVRRFARGLGLGAAGLLLLFLLVLVVATVLVSTEGGSRWVLARVQAALPAELSIGALSGSLRSPLTLTDIRYDTEGLDLELDRLSIRWQLGALLGQTLQIDAVDAQGLRVALREGASPTSPSEPTTGPTLPELPVAIVLESLSLVDASVRTAARDAQPLQLDRLSLAAQWRPERLAISRLELAAPLADLKAQASLTPARGLRALKLKDETARLAAATIELSAEGTLRAADLHPLPLSAAATGTLADLEIDLRLLTPYELTLQGQLAHLLTLPTLALQLNGRPADLRAITAAAPAGSAELKLSARGDLNELTIAGSAALRSSWAAVTGATDATVAGKADALASAMTLRSDLELVYSPERVRIVQLQLREESADEASVGEASPLALDVDGLIELAGSAPRLDVRGGWRGLRWPLTGAATARSDSGKLTIFGTAEDYQAQLEATLATAVGRSERDRSPLLEAGELRFSGRGSTRAFQAQDLFLAAFSGTARGAGTISWEDGLNGDLSLTLADLDFTALAPRWGGPLSGELAAGVSQSGADAPMELSLAPLVLRGDLSTAPLRVDLVLQATLPAAGTTAAADAPPLLLTIDTADLQLGDNRLELEGGLEADALALSFSLNADRLNQLDPTFDGAVSAAGLLSGSWQAPQLELQANAGRLRMREVALEDLDAAMTFGLRPDFSQSAQVRFESLASGSGELGVTTLELDGPLTGHDLSLSTSYAVPSGPAALTIAQRGRASGLPATLAGYQRADALAALRYDFELGALAVSVPQGPQLALQRGGRGEYRHEHRAMVLSSTCLADGAATACVEANLPGNKAGSLRAELAALPLAWARPWLDETFEIGGALGLVAELSVPADGSELQGSARVTGDGIRLDQEGQALLRLAPLQLTMANGEQGFALRASVPLEATAGAPRDGLHAQLEVASGSAPLTERALSGTIALKLAELSWLAELLPPIGVLEGAVASEFDVSGTAAAPVVEGTFNLTAPRLTLIDQNLTFESLTLTARSNPMTPGGPLQAQLEGGLLSGGGSLALQGDLSYDADALAAALSVTGERVQLSNTEQALLYASPEIDLRYTDQGLTLKGRVDVPEADIVFNTLPESAVTISEDQVLVDADQAGADASVLPFDANLTVALGDKVRFAGFGLDARFGGELKVRQRSDEPALGNGEIRIEEGRYQAYGQDLAIETGRALWSDSPIDKPGVDLRAVRKPRPDVVVGVRARGQLDRPEFSLFSTPSMGESDQLSYLVLGRPIEDNSSAESSLLAQAALALSIRGGNFLSDQFGDQLGVDQIGIQTEAGAGTSGAAFVVGKYLTPKLYVSYGLGLLDSVSTLKLEYLLNQRWRLATESSTQASGGDVIYTIERD